MVVATYRVSVDWNNNGTIGDSEEDITTDVLRMEWRRGRDYASQLTGKSSAGTFIADLDDQDGKYASFNTSSAIVTAGGSIVPGLLTIVQMLTPVVETLWAGYLVSIIPIRGANGERLARLIGTGPLGKIGEKKIKALTYANLTTTAAFGYILDDADFPNRYIYATGLTTMTLWYVRNRLVIDALHDVEETEGGFIWETKDFSIAFENRTRRLTATRHVVSQATFSDAAGSARTYRKPEQEDPMFNVFNEFRAGVQRYTTQALAVLWTCTDIGDQSPFIFAGQSQTFIAQYPTPGATNGDDAVLAWTTPVATTDFTVNTAADGTGTNLTTSIGVAVVKASNEMRITLTNNHASLGVYVTFLQARGTRLSKLDLSLAIASDTPSQDIYGLREWPAPAPFIPTLQEAQDYCNRNLAIYKDPAPIVSIEVIGNRDNTHMTEVAERDIGDRITLVADGNAKLGINQDFFIENEHHMVEPGLHRVVWGLSPVSGSASAGLFWVLGTSALGTETALAY